MSGAAPETASATERVRGYEAACATLLALGPIGGYWAENDHCDTWQRALTRLVAAGGNDTYQLWSDMRRYPAALLLYALGLGAVDGGHFTFLGTLFGTEIRGRPGERVAVVQLLPGGTLLGAGGQNAQILEGMDRHYAPVSDWLQRTLRSSLTQLIPDDERYAYVFDKLEVLMALSYASRSSDAGGWAPVGSFGWRHGNRQRIIGEIKDSVASLAGASPYVTAGILGSDPTAAADVISSFEQCVARVVATWH